MRVYNTILFCLRLSVLLIFSRPIIPFMLKLRTPPLPISQLLPIAKTKSRHHYSLSSHPSRFYSLERLSAYLCSSMQHHPISLKLNADWSPLLCMPSHTTHFVHCKSTVGALRLSYPVSTWPPYTRNSQHL